MTPLERQILSSFRPGLGRMSCNFSNGMPEYSAYQVKKAMAKMRKEGLIHYQSGQGWWCATNKGFDLLRSFQ